MASAPTPGVGARKEAANAAQQILTMTIRGESHTLAIGNIPMRERLLVRKETGASIESLIDPIGLESLFVLWWLARRQGGEPLTFDEAAAEWPTDLTEDDLAVDVGDPDVGANDPEA